MIKSLIVIRRIVICIQKKEGIFGPSQQANIAKTDIRVQFPNSVIVQAIFGPLETLKTLYDLIQDMLENSNLDFYLYTSPPPLRMTQKHLNQTFDDLNSVPNGLFYFGVEKQTSNFYLKEQWMQCAREL